MLKSSYALNEARATENVTIDIVFEHCRGLALETVDGAALEDVTISNITMRGVETPIFLRLGARMRGPADLAIGTLSRVSISDVTIHDADPRYPSTIAGIPGHDIQDVRISNLRHYLVGGLTPAGAVQNVPELENAYPENYMFGTLPAYGFYIRHATGIVLDNVRVVFEQNDTRPAFVLSDVSDVDFHHVRADKAPSVPTFDLTRVDDFTVSDGRPVGDIRLNNVTQKEL